MKAWRVSHRIRRAQAESGKQSAVSEVTWRFFLQLFGYYSKDGYNGESVRGRTEGIWVLPALSFLFCYDSKSSLKIRFIDFFKKSFQLGWGIQLIGPQGTETPASQIKTNLKTRKKIQERISIVRYEKQQKPTLQC